MRRALLAVLSLSCGSRTELSASSDAATPTPPSCSDAVDPGAFTPLARYCSDNSNRARSLAPRHPHLAWTKSVDTTTNLGLLVDAKADTYFGDVQSLDVNGQARWDVSTMAEGHALLASGTIFLQSYGSAEAIKLAEADGALSTVAWPQLANAILPRADHSFFVEFLSVHGISTSFAGISLVDDAGSTLWTERGDCDPGGSDFPAPHDFLRRDNDLVLVCNVKGGGVQVIEVDENDAPISDRRMDGELLGQAALAPGGVLAFFVSFDHGMNASLVTMRAGAVELGGASLPSASVVAVAADGTLIASTGTSIAAIRDDQLRWQASMGEVSRVFVDSASSVVVATSEAAMAFDVVTGTKIWSVALPTSDIVAVASGGPGKVYVLQAGAITLLAD